MQLGALVCLGGIVSMAEDGLHIIYTLNLTCFSCFSLNSVGNSLLVPSVVRQDISASVHS